MASKGGGDGVVMGSCLDEDEPQARELSGRGHLVREGQNLLVERIVKLARQFARVFIRVTQIGPANVVHKKQIAGENDYRPAVFPNEKRETVRRVPRRLEQFDFERAELHLFAILRRHPVVMRRGEMRDVNLRAGALGQLAKAGGKIGVWMAVENRDDLESGAFRFLEVILDIAFRVDHRGLAVRAEKIRSVRQPFDKESF